MLQLTRSTDNEETTLLARREAAIAVATAAPFLDVIDDTTQEDACTTLFLDAIVARLAPLPAGTCVEVRRELRVHLDSLIVAHEELGLDRDAATSAAIQQFGDAREISRRFRLAWKRTARYASPWAAMRMASLTFSAALVTACVTMGTLGPVFARANMQGVEFLPPIDNQVLGVGFVLGLPALAGAYVGWRLPHRASFGTFCGLAALAFVTLAFFITSQTTGNGVWGTFCGICPLFTLFWLPIGWFAATLASAIRVRYPKSLRRRFQAWRQSANCAEQKAATRDALATFGIAAALTLTVTSVAMLELNDRLSPQPLLLVSIFALLLGLPILSGMRIARRSPRYATFGTFCALLVLVVATLPLVPYGTFTIGPHSRAFYALHYLFSSAEPLFLIWLPIGTLTAAVASWLRNRRNLCRTPG